MVKCMVCELYLNKNKESLGLLKIIDFNIVIESYNLFFFLIGSFFLGFRFIKVRIYGFIFSFRCEFEYDFRYGFISG